MTIDVQDPPRPTTEPLPELSDRLSAQTRSTHERLDQSIMAARPFDSLEAYGRFLVVQHGIHRDVAPLYASDMLAEVFPGVAARGRLEALDQDLADLGLPRPVYHNDPATESLVAQRAAEVYGWLYVIEGSNLGAAFLLKFARKMGLSEAHGARHLAEPPEGRAPYWKSFKQALNAAPLSDADTTRALAGAEAAFARVQALVHQHMT